MQSTTQTQERWAMFTIIGNYVDQWLSERTFAALYCHTRRVEGGGSARKYKAVIDCVKLEQQNLDVIERSAGVEEAKGSDSKENEIVENGIDIMLKVVCNEVITTQRMICITFIGS